MQNFGRGMWRRVGDYSRIQSQQIVQYNQIMQKLQQQVLKRKKDLNRDNLRTKCAEINEEPKTTEPIIQEEPMPGTIEESIPGTIEESIPGTIEESIPGTIEESIPGTIEEPMPSTIEESIPGTIEEPIIYEHQTNNEEIIIKSNPFHIKPKKTKRKSKK